MVGQLRFRLKTNGTTSTLVTGYGAITTGQWYHVAAVYNGSNMIIYKNGVQAASTAKSGSITNGNASVAFGNQPAGAGARAFDGLLDEVCLYDKALSPTEISYIMTNGCVSNGNPPTPTPTSTATPAGSNITIYAAGRDGSEQMSLLIDDQVVETFYNVAGDYSNGQFEAHSYQHNAPVQAAQIKVRFDNDSWSGVLRDLRVGHISIDGAIYQTEAPATDRDPFAHAHSHCDCTADQRSHHNPTHVLLNCWADGRRAGQEGSHQWLY